MTTAATMDTGVAPLRVDSEVRSHLSRDPSPERRRTAAALLMKHGMVGNALFLLTDDGDGLPLRVEGCRLLGPRARRSRWVTIATEVEASGTGRAAFELCLLAGRESAAERVAERTFGAGGELLRAELALRRGMVPAGCSELGAVNRLRAAWLRGDLREVARAEPALADDELAEGALLRAAALRRRGERVEARKMLDRARLSARAPLPVVGLETLLQHLDKPRVRVSELELLAPMAWALDERVEPVTWPALRGLA